MKVAVVGSGAIGLYFGGKLARGGADVRFLMRSGLREARAKGLEFFEESTEDWKVSSPRLAETTAEIGPADVVLVCLKTTSNSSLPLLLPPLIGKQTLLLTLQNGIGLEEDLRDSFPECSIAGGLCFICLNRVSPASVRQIGRGSITLGQLNAPPSNRLREICDRWNSAGQKAVLADNLLEARWKKLLWNIPFNGLGVAAGGISVDQILSDPANLARCRDLISEAHTTANLLGCAIDREFADHQISRTYAMNDYLPSTVLDYLAGRALEIEPIWGRPLQLARKAGIQMPHLAKLHDELLAIARATPSTHAKP